jgi:hypothetical protein
MLLPAFILVVFPAMIDLFGKPASLRQRAPRGATLPAR